MKGHWVDHYCKRIHYNGSKHPNSRNLANIHQSHLLTVPFEDLDIHYKRPLSLKFEDLYRKVVKRKRGGFCYELNHLFGCLLMEMGYQVRRVAAQVYDDNGVAGPYYDHMALLVTTEVEWLVDVGYGGGSFLRPLILSTTEVQKDEAGFYRITSRGPGQYQLRRSSDQINYQPLYSFDNKLQSIEKFEEECQLKQVNPQSHFVKNKICTVATSYGRKTLFNNSFTNKVNGEKTVITIEDPQTEKQLLAKHFGIII